MRIATTSLATAIGVMLVTACSRSRVQSPNEPAPSAGAPESARSSATVISAAELQTDPRPLLDLLQRRFTNLRVTPTSACPEVHLRGRSTVATPSNPAIYVDGTRASNTCVLTTFSTIDLERVEVYPSGVPNRPGYRTDPNGVILIFLRKAGP